MLKLYGCITEAHDLRLVALACAICAVGSFTTLRMLARAQVASGQARLVWIGASGIAFGCGVWVTHFIAMLGYQPNAAFAFDLSLTALSLLVAIVGGCLAFGCAVMASRRSTIVAGLLLGGTIGTMHFAGMAATEVPGLLVYDPVEVAEAWAAGLLFAPLALLRYRAGSILQATVLLVLAVAGLHFTAMAAIVIIPNSTPVAGVGSGSLAIAVAAAGLLVLLASLGIALVDQHLELRTTRDNARFRRFSDATFEGLFFVEHGIIRDVNAVVCGMLGRPATQIVGAPLASFFAPECRDAIEALNLVSDGAVELVLIDDADCRCIVDVLVRALAVDDATLVVAVRDASERKLAERRIHELVHSDALTGLANRLLLRDRLAQAVAIAERSETNVAVLCFDLDRFKAVNDTMGHHAGDRLLIEVANRLRATARDSDTVARLGGDEFIVVQPFAGPPENTQAFAKRLVQVLAEPYLIDGCKLEVTSSIGIALYPNDASAGEMLLKQADLALYRAKDEDRGGYRFFEPAMDTQMRARRSMEQDLRQALSNHEFRLHYQPVFYGDRLTLVGYEALLRWQHPVRGNVPPDQFIPIAEECGAILPIGEWVLATACAEAASWPEPHRIAVNLSPAQFKNPNLPAQVANTLARAGLAPERLELEVTEGVLINDTQLALGVFAALKAQGIRIALDDFGSGYSSLSYLRRFPFDRLKIDRSFINELGTDADADAIVRSILAMSRSLRLDVTAEGVETEQQLALLQTLGCDYLQGFLLGRPMPASSLAHLRMAPVAPV